MPSSSAPLSVLLGPVREKATSATPLMPEVDSGDSPAHTGCDSGSRSCTSNGATGATRGPGGRTGRALTRIVADQRHRSQNVRLPAWLDRVLRLVVVTPEMHRVHHS